MLSKLSNAGLTPVATCIRYKSNLSLSSSLDNLRYDLLVHTILSILLWFVSTSSSLHLALSSIFYVLATKLASLSLVVLAIV